MNDTIGSLAVYSLSIYFFFHVWNRSSLLLRPRNWVNKTFWHFLVEMSQCSFCFTFWFGLCLVGFSFIFLPFAVFPIFFFAAPVINFILDVIIVKLTKENKPLVLNFPEPKPNCVGFDNSFIVNKK